MICKEIVQAFSCGGDHVGRFTSAIQQARQNNTYMELIFMRVQGGLVDKETTSQARDIWTPSSYEKHKMEDCIPRQRESIRIR